MAAFPVQFTQDTFEQAFPFGFVADEHGVVQVFGSALRRRMDTDDPRPIVDDLFELIRPRGPERIASAVGMGKRITLLRTRKDGLQLKGQLVPSGADGAFVFLGTTAVQSLEEMRSFDLQLIDFAAHDSTPDLLMMLQANEASLEDARKMGIELEAAVDTAEAASDAKGRFLAMMSHEIRTTLNGLGSMVDILKGTELEGEQVEAVEVMDTSSAQLSTLLNDILDLSRIESGAVTVESIPFDLKSAIENVMRLFRAKAEERGLDLSLELDPNLSPWIQGDPTRVRQVLSNLVGNALKFTSQGRVSVRVMPLEGNLIRFDVQDTGSGVPEASRANLFEPFGQADHTITRRFGGTGLGLAICRQLCELMGGDIILAESSEFGSTFRFTITALAAEEPTVEPAQRATHEAFSDLSSLSVLVAEDHPTNRLIVRRLLDRLSVEADIVEDGALAVEAVRARNYDVVLMDLGMPVMDGASACRAIRELDVAWNDLEVIAFTAGVFHEDREAARDAGMSGFLTKPVRLPHLREALARAAVRIRSNADRSATP